jgi:hypothetical protein
MATERRDGVPWPALLLVPLLCLPCVLATAGGVAVLAAGGAAITGALLDSVVLGLVLGGLVLALAAVGGAVMLRRRRARACLVGGDCAPVAAPRSADRVR